MAGRADEIRPSSTVSATISEPCTDHLRGLFAPLFFLQDKAMSDCHGRPHRTATPSEEKARCSKAFCRLIKNRKNSLHVCCVPKSGVVSLIPQKIQGVATQILMSACGTLKNYERIKKKHMKNNNQNLSAKGVSLTPAQWERCDRLTDEYGKKSRNLAVVNKFSLSHRRYLVKMQIPENKIR